MQFVLSLSVWNSQVCSYGTFAFEDSCEKTKVELRAQYQ